MKRRQIFTLNNIKHNLGKNEEKLEENMCHNNCKILCDYINEDKNLDEDAVIVGGWMWRILPGGINCSYHFSVFSQDVFYDAIDGYFLPLFKINSSDWQKDNLRLSMCSYYANVGIEQIEKDVTSLYESISSYHEDPNRFSEHKKITISEILRVTREYLELGKKSGFTSSLIDQHDFAILKYREIITNF